MSVNPGAGGNRLRMSKQSENGEIMSPQERQSTHELDHEQARLAYSIIESLIEHTQIISNLVALMARTLDQDTTKALTQTPQWTAYLESRRVMERTRADVETFAKIMKELSED
jgi:hypothetical protein